MRISDTQLLTLERHRRQACVIRHTIARDISKTCIALSWRKTIFCKNENKTKIRKQRLVGKIVNNISRTACRYLNASNLRLQIIFVEGHAKCGVNEKFVTCRTAEVNTGKWCHTVQALLMSKVSVRVLTKGVIHHTTRTLISLVCVISLEFGPKIDSVSFSPYHVSSIGCNRLCIEDRRTIALEFQSIILV